MSTIAKLQCNVGLSHFFVGQLVNERERACNEVSTFTLRCKSPAANEKKITGYTQSIAGSVTITTGGERRGGAHQ
jgi:hypothetical protein